VAALRHIAARFAAGLSPLSVQNLAKTLRLPPDVIEDALLALAEASMLAPLGDDDDRGFTLGVAPENIRLADVVSVLENCGEGMSCGAVVENAVDDLFGAFDAARRSSPANATLAGYAAAEAAALRGDAARARELARIRGAENKNQ